MARPQVNRHATFDDRAVVVVILALYGLSVARVPLWLQQLGSWFPNVRDALPRLPDIASFLQDVPIAVLIGLFWAMVLVYVYCRRRRAGETTRGSSRESRLSENEISTESEKTHDLSTDSQAADGLGEESPSVAVQRSQESLAEEKMEEELEEFQAGEICVLEGLTSSAGALLNGSQGVVMGKDAETGRFHVRLSPDDSKDAWKKVHPRNLRPVSSSKPQNGTQGHAGELAFGGDRSRDLTPGDDMEICPAEFEIGETCSIQGLSSATGKILNGKTGTVMGKDEASGRVLVCLRPEDGKDAWKKIHPRNLKRNSSSKCCQATQADKATQTEPDHPNQNADSHTKASASTAMEENDLELSAGDACVIRGLTSDAGKSLNGSKGIVMGSDPETGRLLVRLHPDDCKDAWKKIHSRNLRLRLLQKPAKEKQAAVKVDVSKELEIVRVDQWLKPPELYPSAPGTKVLKELGDKINCPNAYCCLTAAPNGLLYAPPYDATRVLEIDPNSGVVREIGDELEGKAKYACIVVGSNGLLYAAPCNATRVLEINPQTGTVEAIGHEVQGEAKYYSIAASRSGRLYAAPCNAASVLEIDPVTKIVSEIVLEIPGTLKYYCIVVAPNGRLYAPPYAADRVLEIDPETRGAREIGIKIDGDAKYRCMAAVSNGRLYASPFSAPHVLEVDSSTGHVRLIGDEMHGVAKYSCIVAVPTGFLYAPPCNAKRVLEIDSHLGRAREIGEDVPGKDKFSCIAAVPSGPLYACPSSASHVLVVIPENGVITEVNEEVNGRYSAIALGGNEFAYALPSKAGKVLQIGLPASSPPPSSDTSTEPAQIEFDIVLDCKASKKLGVVVEPWDDGMVVTVIRDEGALPEWNRKNKDSEVRVGDLIVAVDGRRAGYDELFEGLQTAVEEREMPTVKVKRHSAKQDVSGMMQGDVMIRVGDKNFNCHRGVLARVKFFRDLFDQEANHALHGKVKVEGISPAAFKHVLRIIYVGHPFHLHVMSDTSILGELLEAAERFEINSVKAETARRLTELLEGGIGLTADTVAFWLSLARRCKIDEIAKLCIAHTSRHAADVLLARGTNALFDSDTNAFAELVHAALGQHKSDGLPC